MACLSSSSRCARYSCPLVSAGPHGRRSGSAVFTPSRRVTMPLWCSCLNVHCGARAGGGARQGVAGSTGMQPARASCQPGLYAPRGCLHYKNGCEPAFRCCTRFSAACHPSCSWTTQQQAAARGPSSGCHLLLPVIHSTRPTHPSARRVCQQLHPHGGVHLAPQHVHLCWGEGGAKGHQARVKQRHLPCCTVLPAGSWGSSSPHTPENCMACPRSCCRLRHSRPAPSWLLPVPHRPSMCNQSARMARHPRRPPDVAAQARSPPAAGPKEVEGGWRVEAVAQGFLVQGAVKESLLWSCTVSS